MGIFYPFFSYLIKGVVVTMKNKQRKKKANQIINKARKKIYLQALAKIEFDKNKIVRGTCSTSKNNITGLIRIEKSPLKVIDGNKWRKPIVFGVPLKRVNEVTATVMLLKNAIGVLNYWDYF